jgi:hypothetical protein
MSRIYFSFSKIILYKIRWKHFAIFNFDVEELKWKRFCWFSCIFITFISLWVFPGNYWSEMLKNYLNFRYWNQFFSFDKCKYCNIDGENDPIEHNISKSIISRAFPNFIVKLNLSMRKCKTLWFWNKQWNP